MGKISKGKCLLICCWIALVYHLPGKCLSDKKVTESSRNGGSVKVLAKDQMVKLEEEPGEIKLFLVDYSNKTGI